MANGSFSEPYEEIQIKLIQVKDKKEKETWVSHVSKNVALTAERALTYSPTAFPSEVKLNVSVSSQHDQRSDANTSSLLTFNTAKRHCNEIN